jgi:hypothetical protein
MFAHFAYSLAAAPVAANPQDTTVGDVHYYNYDADCWDVSTFPRPRFASEYGFESFPSLLTLAPVSNQSLGDWSYNSAFLEHRQHHPGMKTATNLFEMVWCASVLNSAFALLRWPSADPGSD